MTLGTFKMKASIQQYFLLLVLIIYFLNLFTPLRLNTDVIRYLSLLEYLKGNPIYREAQYDFLPLGYPYLLLMLNKIGIASTFFTSLINLFSLLKASQWMASMLKVKNTILLYLLVLLSFVNIKHFTLLVTDQLFLLSFTGSLYYWNKFLENKRVFGVLVAAIGFTFLSIALRSVGLIIVPGIVIYFIFSRIKWERKVWFGFVMIGAILLYFGISNGLIESMENKSAYFSQLNLGQLIENPFSLMERFAIHFKELGEIILNIPFSKLTRYIHFKGLDPVEYGVVFIGLVFIGVLILGVIKLHLYRHFIFWPCMCYFFFILIWPFYDTRFFIPILPFLASIVVGMVDSYEGRIRKVYLLFIPYVLLGCISLAYSTALSLNKKTFLKQYGADVSITRKYEIYFNGQDRAGESDKDHVFDLLDKYDCLICR